MVTSYMKVHCPICKVEMNGMTAYGRESRCCGKVCHNEWEWRRALAIMGKDYYPKPDGDGIIAKWETVGGN